MKRNGQQGAVMKHNRTRRIVGVTATAAFLFTGAASIQALTSGGSDDISQQSTGIIGVSEAGDFFASAVGVGDFDNDGYADVIVGSPFEDVGKKTDAGIVQVFYGTANGVTASGDVLYHQGSPGVPGALEAGDMFGAAVAVGDFDDDGYDDAAISSPGEDGSASATDMGSVQVLYGSSSGLRSSGADTLSQSSSGVAGVAEAYDTFGHALATGDFDDDGYDDLAVGVPGEALGSLDAAGVAHVFYGRSSGLSGSGSDVFHQNTAGVPGAAEIDDGFGSALAVGDFDNDGEDDLAVGVPGEALGSRAAAGAINVLYGHSSGLRGTGSKFFSQNSSGVVGTGEAGDAFGAAVASGDFDNDGRDDLAIGAPGEALGSKTASGMINIMYGKSGGLSGSGSGSMSQNHSSIAGSPEAGDEFGLSLAAGDFNNDGRDDLVIGAPGEGRGSNGGAGGIHVVYGSSSGLRTSGSEWWAPGSNGLDGAAEANAGVGRVVATGDIDGDNRDDVVVGAPGGTIGSVGGAGSLLVIYG